MGPEELGDTFVGNDDNIAFLLYKGKLQQM